MNLHLARPVWTARYQGGANASTSAHKEATTTLLPAIAYHAIQDANHASAHLKLSAHPATVATSSLLLILLVIWESARLKLSLTPRLWSSL